MRIVTDENNNIYKLIAVSGNLPEGLIDITHLEIQEELQGLDLKFLECVDGVIQKKSTADIDRRNEILQKLREVRQPLLDKADIEINKLLDTDGDLTEWKAYRQALRDVPAAHIKVNGDPKVSVDTIDIDNFVWPTKPGV